MRLILSSVFFFFLITCLSASGQKIYATYDIRVSSIKIGKLNWIVQINNDNFSNEINLISEGLLSGLYSFEGHYLSEGKTNKGPSCIIFFEYKTPAVIAAKVFFGLDSINILAFLMPIFLNCSAIINL